MKILSFDIGIKNMALCCLEVNNENKRTDILHWDILNLLHDDSQTQCICNQYNKAKSKKQPPTVCQKKAKFKKNDQYYCDKHAKSSPFLVPTKSMKLPFLKKQKVDFLISLSHSLFLFENTHEKMKKEEYVEKIFEHYEKKSLEPIQITKTKAGDVDLIDIGIKMKKELDKYDFQDIQHVVIENQLSPLASRMKTIQGMLAQYFIMKYENVNIHFVSSANKLKQFETDKPKKNASESQNKGDVQNPNYKEHKKDGIYYTNQIILQNNNFEPWKQKMETRKKDDLADCFLQGLWFFKHKNIILYADDLKIKLV